MRASYDSLFSKVKNILEEVKEYYSNMKVHSDILDRTVAP